MQKRLFLAAALFLAVSAAAGAADMSKIPDPTVNAKVGQWVSYKNMGGGETKQTITALEGSGDDRTITFRIEMIMNGSPAQSTEQKVSIKEVKAMQNAAWENSQDVTIADGKATVKGKEIPVVIVNVANAGQKMKMTMSEAIPVTALVKMEIDGLPAPMVEIEDFGE